MERSVLIALAALCFGANAHAVERLVLQQPEAGQGTLAELRSSPHKIVFEAYAGDNWDLFVMNADGSGKRNLTQTPNIHEMYPQASPDGARICFVADVQKAAQTLRSVYVMNTDGNSRTLVADNARQPCWSPDGSRIAYCQQEYPRFSVKSFANKGLYVYDFGTGQTKQHANQSIEHLFGLSWSPDGRWIVTTVHGGLGYGHAIVAIEIEGPRIHDLKIRGCRPCLDPAGTRVTWSRDDHTICVGDVELGDDAARVSNVEVLDHDEKLHLYHPDFSPDGQYITYSVGPGGRMPADGPGTHVEVAETVGVRGKWDLFLKPATGAATRIRLTQDPAMSNKESEWIVGSPSEKRTLFNHPIAR